MRPCAHRVRPNDRHERRDEHRPEHEDVAVGEVDELEDPVDERVAERDEAVDRAVRQADQEEAVELGRVVDEVDAEPERDSMPTKPMPRRRKSDPRGGIAEC